MDTGTWLQHKVENIVRSQGQVRRDVATAVASAAKRAHEVADGLAGIVRASLEGAAKGIEAAVPHDRASALREVVDGLGDGLATAAHAAELTLREAAGDSARYARADLEKLGNDFDTVSRDFVDSVAETAAIAGGQAAHQVGALYDHAAATLARIAPSLGAVVDAARRDPAGLGHETLAAGAGAARGAVGALFATLGRKLQDLGAILEPRGPA